MFIGFEAKPHPDMTEQIQDRLDRYRKEADRSKDWNFKPEDSPTGREILELDARQRVLTICEIIRRSPSGFNQGLFALRSRLMAKNLPFTAEDLDYLLTLVVESKYIDEINNVLRAIRHFVDSGNALTNAMRSHLIGMQRHSKDMSGIAEYRKALLAAQELLNSDIAAELDFEPEQGDIWADAVREDLAKMPEDSRRKWGAILFHALDSEASKPSAKWEKRAKKNIEAIGQEAFTNSLSSWLNQVTIPANCARGYYDGDEVVSQINVSLVRGLAWYAALVDTPEMVRTLAHVAEATFRKILGVGPWGVRAGNAAIGALGRMTTAEAVGQLCRLRLRIPYRPSRTFIEKTIEEAAKRAGISREDLEYLAVPTYGLDASGNWAEVIGDYLVNVTLTPTGVVQVQWYNGDKPVKSVPAAVKSDYAVEWKEFKADVDALGKMLTAQRDRLEAALFPRRTWNLGVWRERYQNHPLLGYLTRRLLWEITEQDRSVVVLPEGDQLVDSAGEGIYGFTDGATVRLWHPIEGTMEEVALWRSLLEARGIVQSFKQAHREVYLLTDAERATRTYSNRFAGHILKQHQVNALAVQRGWKYALQMGYDGSGAEPAVRELPEQDLYAEFWVESTGEGYSNAGAALYLSTDQVRFYRMEPGQKQRDRWRHRIGNPLPLEEVPALVFSEVMRDVDLFVGVTSVGNDPNWADGGPDGRYRNYWEQYSFGELNASAKTRAEVLSRLLPRLKIASRCIIDGRFLVVRGDLRTYKIHLGSGNILMTPNDQYLCIVEERGRTQEGVFLPFEGDARFSLILSKAFLLAEDKKITDPTITRQIAGA